MVRRHKTFVRGIFKHLAPSLHMMIGLPSAHGRVLEKTYTVDGFKDDKREMTEAFFGLVPAADGGFWAITSGALYHFGADATKKEEYALPKLKPVSGIYLSRELPGVIVVRTDANWAVSVSGYTPVLIALDGSEP